VLSLSEFRASGALDTVFVSPDEAPTTPHAGGVPAGLADGLFYKSDSQPIKSLSHSFDRLPRLPVAAQRGRKIALKQTQWGEMMALSLTPLGLAFKLNPWALAQSSPLNG